MTLSIAKADTHEQRQAAAAREAADILQEKAPRTAAEQAAINVLNERRWVLWHAEDYSLGVIRLLSLRGLLRDIEHEKQQAKADQFWSEHSERARVADRAALGRLSVLAEQAADRLDAGDDPADVAKWLRETRDRITEAREKATSTTN
jgi:hypothetical protein